VGRASLQDTPSSEATSAYRFVSPELVSQGETFTAQVVEQTPQGEKPLPEGDVVSFQGQVVPVKSNGTVEVPAFARELGNVFLTASVLLPSVRGQGEPQSVPITPEHVEVLPPSSSAAPVPTQISQSPQILAGGQPIRVQGQSLQALQSAWLETRDGTKVNLNDSVGSSLERIYFPPQGTPLPKGDLRFVGTDAGGTRYEAPALSRVPSYHIEGPEVKTVGQVGTLTLTSDTDGRAVILGGEPTISLTERVVTLHTGQPAHVKFTANHVGVYTVGVRPLPKEEIPPGTKAPPADAQCGPVQTSFNPSTNETTVNAPVHVTDAKGKPVANTSVDMALQHPQGVSYGRVTTDSQGRATLSEKLPGQVNASALSSHIFRVLGYAWNKVPSKPPSKPPVEQGGTPPPTSTPSAAVHPKPGDGVSFQVTLTNTTDTPQKAKVQDPVPPGASRLDPSSVRVTGSTTTPNNQSSETSGVNVTDITVPPGGTATVSYTYSVGNVTQEGVSVTNAAWVNDQPTNSATTPTITTTGTNAPLKTDKKYTGTTPGTTYGPGKEPPPPIIPYTPEIPKIPTTTEKKPCDCKCSMVIQFSTDGPIQVRFASPATDQTLNVPLGAEVPLAVNAADIDLLTVSCIKEGCGPNPCPPCQSMTVQALPGTLRYRWELVSGPGELVSDPQYPHRHSAIAFGPASIYKAPDEMPDQTDVTIRLTVEDSPEYIADINDKPFVKLVKFKIVKPGQAFHVPVQDADVKPPTPSPPPPSDCSCQPELKWDADKQITPTPDGQTQFAVGVNGYLVLQAGATDVDQLTMRCKDPTCSSPETVLHLNDAIFFRWQADKGQIIGKSDKVVYQAPAAPGNVKVDRWVRDSGVHPGPAHEGEKQLPSVTVEVFSVTIIEAGDYIVPTPSNEPAVSASLERSRLPTQSFGATQGSPELKLGQRPDSLPGLLLEQNVLGLTRWRFASWNPDLGRSMRPSGESGYQLASQSDPELPLPPSRFYRPLLNHAAVSLAELPQPQGPGNQGPVVPGSGSNVIRYTLNPSPVDAVRLEVRDKDSKLVRTITGLPTANNAWKDNKEYVDYKWDGLDDCKQPLKQEGSPFVLRVVATKSGAESKYETTAQVKSWKFTYRISDRPDGAAAGASGIDVNTVTTELVQTTVQPDGGDAVRVPVYGLKESGKDVDVTLLKSYADGDFFLVYTSPTKPNKIGYTITVQSKPGGALDKAGNEWDMDPHKPGIQRKTTWTLHFDENGKVIQDAPEKIE
jgi:hypothetical protein